MRITLRNEALVAELSTLGGAIESLRDRRTGREHIWPYDANVWPRRTSICFPICSALRGGNYAYQGARYSLPMHGFLRECDLQLVSCWEDRAVMRYAANGWTRKMYPFAFQFELVQHLVGRGLAVEYRVTNLGDGPLPFSVGSHYAYGLPGKQSRCSFLFSGAQHAGRLELADGVVVGKSADFFRGASRLSMRGLFEDGSKIFETADLATDYIAVGTQEAPFTIVEYEGFAYTVLWAPRGGNSPFACVEAWAGMADDAGHTGELLKKKGIQIAQPGQTRVFRQTISIG